MALTNNSSHTEHFKDNYKVIYFTKLSLYFPLN